jgi:hypothetical protein
MNSNKANHFYKAWEKFVELTNSAHADYIVASDIVSLVKKPSFNDPTTDNKTIAVQYQIYNRLNQRLRFYKSRYQTLQNARDNAFKVWLQLKKESKTNE